MPIHLKSEKKSYLLNITLDFILLIFSFLVIYYAKRGHLDIEQSMVDYLPFYIFSWIVPTLLSQKFRVHKSAELIVHLKPYIVSVLLQMGIMSVILYGFKWFALSRFIVLGSVALFFLLELLLLSGSYIVPFVLNKEKVKKSNFSFFFFFLEFLLITSVFLSLYFYKKGTFRLTDEYKAVFVLIYFTWIFIGLLVHKFKVAAGRNYLKTLWPYIKATIIQLSVISFFVFAFRILEYSRLVLFGTVLFFALFEYFIVTLYYLYTKKPASDEPEVDIFSAAVLDEVEFDLAKKESERLVSGKYTVPDSVIESVSIRRKLKNVYLKKFPQIFEFIDETVNLEAIDFMTSEIISSGNPYNVEVLPNHSLNMFFNLHEVNDFRRINQYFNEVNKKLRRGGIFAGRFQPYSKRRSYIYKKYPHYLAAVVYFFDFIWKRIFPKLPFFQKIYFAVSKGRNRVFSKTEALGRLYFCGFEIIALEEIDDYIFYVVKKTGKPLEKENPSYGPLFKMKRSGKDGKPIYVYKFRTMHPYSEYLQDYVTSRNGYDANGKLKNDFRVTAWGKIMRKYWIDEFPQIINLLKGEMTFVGIRPISERFLQEFPEDIREIRKKYKPGCIPAYVSLLKQSKDGFIEAETIYLLEKEKHPIKTDIKYLWFAFYNIFTNKIRSA